MMGLCEISFLFKSFLPSFEVCGSLKQEQSVTTRSTKRANSLLVSGLDLQINLIMSPAFWVLTVTQK
jgi:hypothetical protein